MRTQVRFCQWRSSHGMNSGSSSMGGLLAADALIEFVRTRPDSTAPLWPNIVACIAFDTPVRPPRLPLLALLIIPIVPWLAPIRLQEQRNRSRLLRPIRPLGLLGLPVLHIQDYDHDHYRSSHA